MDEAASNPGDKELIGDDEFDDAIKFLAAALQHGTQFLGLGDCAGKTVQDKSAPDE